MIGSPRGQFTHDLRNDNRYLIEQHLHGKSWHRHCLFTSFYAKSVNIKTGRHDILALSNFPAGNFNKTGQLYFGSPEIARTQPSWNDELLNLMFFFCFHWCDGILKTDFSTQTMLFCCFSERAGESARKSVLSLPVARVSRASRLVIHADLALCRIPSASML